MEIQSRYKIGEAQRLSSIIFLQIDPAMMADPLPRLDTILDLDEACDQLIKFTKSRGKCQK